MRRVAEVIDCWYDSGAMPFAQWGYPHRGAERFAAQFPADFISEALDQTRGWFYSLMAISTLLFGDDDPVDAADDRAPAPPFPHPFRNCIVLGLMLGEDGQKMSKKLRNYREPNEIFDRYGADALRWFFFANQPPWTSIRYQEQAIKDSMPEFLLRLWNCYSFFCIYANIDGFDPGGRLAGKPGQLDGAELARARGYRPAARRGELDRWMLCELHRTARGVVERMDAYDNFGAANLLVDFVDGLSNWYVRRSRDRFWSGAAAEAKEDAYWTLYECLVALSKLIAPFTPFLAETIWQNLAVAGAGATVESVHLCDYPTGDPEVIDESLSRHMRIVRDVVSLARAARAASKLKVRQPLAKVEVILADPRNRAFLESQAALIADEINVKQVEFALRADQYVTYLVQPDLKKVGPKLGKRLPAVKQALAAVDAAALLLELETAGHATLRLPEGEVVLEKDDIQVRLQAKEGWAAAHGPAGVVVLSTAITAELAIEGLARELVHAIHAARKDVGCAYTDRIRVGIDTASVDLATSLERMGDYIRGETLAVELVRGTIPGGRVVEVSIAGEPIKISILAASSGSSP
jgi:isoleucyl-tRNA synthetase